MFTHAVRTPQGLDFPEGVFIVNEVRRNDGRHTSETYDYDISAPEPAPREQNTTTGEITVTYQVYLWKDQATLDAGGMPLYLTNIDPMGTYFTMAPDFALENNALGLVDLVEKHLKEVILVKPEYTIT